MKEEAEEQKCLDRYVVYWHDAVNPIPVSKKVVSTWWKLHTGLTIGSRNDKESPSEATW